MAQISGSQLTSVGHMLGRESRIYAFASKLNSFVCWTFIRVGFPIQNAETSHSPSLAPSPVRRWYVPPTRTFSPDYPPLPSPGHILLRGHILVGRFRPRTTPLPAVSDLLIRLKGWNIVRNQDWTFFTLSCRPACDIMYRLVTFNNCLMSLGRRVFGDFQGPVVNYPFVSTLILVLCAATFFTLLAPLKVAISSTRTPTSGYSLNCTRNVYGVDTIVRAMRGGPTALAHRDSCFDDTMLSSTGDNLVGLITYVPCSTYSVLLFVNANQIYKRPITQKDDSPSELPVPQKQTAERSRTEDGELEDRETLVETLPRAKGERTRKTRRGKRGGVSQKEHQAKRLEWQQAWKRAVDTWGNGAWLEMGLDEEVETAVD